jgi:hypothetical protein
VTANRGVDWENQRKETEFLRATDCINKTIGKISIINLYVHGSTPNLHTLTLKMEAACTSETLETLPTSTDRKRSRTESVSTVNHGDSLKSV